VDRFLLKLRVGYPSRDEEKEILRRSMAGFPTLKPVLTIEHLLHARDVMSAIRFDEKLLDYVLDLVAATRDPGKSGLADLANLIEFGGSPRATMALEKAARAHAFLSGRAYVNSADVKTMAPDVLRHRVVLTYEAEAEEVDADAVIQRILASVPVP
jgi:MoxR-like ATPase